MTEREYIEKWFQSEWGVSPETSRETFLHFKNSLFMKKIPSLISIVKETERVRALNILAGVLHPCHDNILDLFQEKIMSNEIASEG